MTELAFSTGRSDRPPILGEKAREIYCGGRSRITR